MAWRQCRRQDSSHGVSHNASRSLGCAGCNAAHSILSLSLFLSCPPSDPVCSSSFYIFPGTVGTVVFLIYTLPPPVERRAQSKRASERERVPPLFNRIPSYSVYGPVNTGFVGPATSPSTRQRCIAKISAIRWSRRKNTGSDNYLIVTLFGIFHFDSQEIPMVLLRC